MNPHRPTKQERALAEQKRRWRNADNLARDAEELALHRRRLANAELFAWLSLVEPLATKALKGRS